MEEQQFQRNLASYQQEQEFLKHLTTLSTGSIVLVVTFLEKLFAKPEWKVLVGVALVSFLLSIIGSLAVHLSSVFAIEKGPRTVHGVELALGLVIIVLAFGGFLLGVTALAIFAIKNLY